MGLATRYLTRPAPSVLLRFAGITAFFLIIDEILIIFWQRRGRGVGELIRTPFRFLKYFVCTVIAFAVFGRNAFVVLSLFTWFRRVDDVVDEDAPISKGLTIRGYRAQKSALLAALAHDACADLLVEDVLLLKGLDTAKRQGFTVLDEVVDIWDVMEWGCEQQESGRLASRSELLTHTAKQDRAILRVMVKTCRGDIARFDEIARGLTGSFTRADWLDDMLEDVRRGVINIPSEAISEYRVDLDRVRSCSMWGELMAYPEFAEWYRDEVRRSREEWRAMRAALGDDFGGVFSSKFTTWAFTRITVGKVEPQFKRAARRAA